MGKSCIIAIAKNEEKYLKDWVHYHHNLGFDKIVIFDNNDVNNNGQISIINQLKKKVDIGAVNVKGREKLEKDRLTRRLLFKGI